MKPAKVRVRVPATTANLGPGFDCLGMALDLFNEVTLAPGERFSVEVRGEGEASFSRDRDNLVFKAVSKVYERVGQPLPPLSLYCHNRIPLSRGLGSSAAAVVGGLVAANALLGSPLSAEDLLAMAAAREGHADNVAAALFGGCRLVLQEGESFTHFPIPLPPGLTAVLFIPSFPLPTTRARQVLPRRVPREDAVYNLGRVALLVAALFSGEVQSLRLATQDRLHQPYRRALFPAMEPLFEAALNAGALGTFLSGAGSAVLALCLGEEPAPAIGAAMLEAARGAGIDGKIKTTHPTPLGAEVLRGD